MQRYAETKDSDLFAVARFQSCTAELRQAVGKLREVEQGMQGALQEMSVQRHPRERLLVAQTMLLSVQAALDELDVFSPVAASRAPAEHVAAS